LLYSSFVLESDAVGLFGRKRQLDFEKSEDGILSVVLDRVCRSTSLTDALRVCDVILNVFASDSAWQTMRERLTRISHVEKRDCWAHLSVASALDGSFSLFKVFACLELEEPGSANKKFQSVFAEHLNERKVVQAHLCLEVMTKWSEEGAKEEEEATSGLNTAIAEEEAVSDEERGNESENPVSPHALLLAEASKTFLEGGGALAWHVWQRDLGAVFWRCASFVELARKTPSEAVVIKVSLNI
jgi:hypothetical protein